MVTEYLKVVNTNKDASLLLVEMSQEMYQYICYVLLQQEHENKVEEKVEELKKIK